MNPDARGLWLILAVAGCQRAAIPPQKPRNDVTSCRAAGSPARVDLVFLFENSNGPEPVVEGELNARFPLFIQAMNDLAVRGTSVDLHLGVLTSDYGAGATGAPGCQPSPGGQGGRLQAIGAAAPNTCKGPIGSSFVKYIFDANAIGSNNLPANQDLAATFSCMASVGASGCGFEHHLEAAHAALAGGVPENAGFLRDDALLAVVFVVDEDDSSAPSDSDLFDKNKSMYGYEDSFRSTQYGIVCGPDPATLLPYADSMGVLSDCRPAPNPPGKLFDVARYVNDFTRPRATGGLKTSPLDVTLAAIDGPAEPVQIILSDPGTAGGAPYGPCSFLPPSSQPPCVPVLQHSCQNPMQPGFYADPAVRLNAVVNAVENHAIYSLCNADYSVAVRGIAARIASQLGACCLPSAPAPELDCVVQDLATDANEATTATEIPRCPASPPCWRVEMKVDCAGVGVTIERGGRPAPPRTHTRAACVGA